MLNYLLFFYLLYIQILPITHDQNELALLFLILIISLAKIFSKSNHVPIKSTFSKTGFFVMKLLLFNAIIFSYFGFLNNQPGALDYILLDILLPLTYIIVFCSDYSAERLKLFHLSFTVSAFIIGIIFWLQILNFAGITEFVIKLSNDELEQRVAYGEGQIVGLRFIPLYSLSYLIPINFHYLLQSISSSISSKQKKQNFTGVWIYAFNFFSGLVCIFVAARQGLIVGFFASVFLLFVIQILLPSPEIAKRKYAWKSLIKTIGLLTFTLFLLFSLNSYFDYIQINAEYFQRFLTKNQEDSERLSQLNSLLDSWSESPVFGHGNGATVSVVRNDERPWRYELGYVLRLNNTGLLGLTIYSSALFLLCVLLINKFYKTNELIYLASLNGLISLLLADATNPYMVRFTVFYYLYYCIWLTIIPDTLSLTQSSQAKLYQK